MPRSSLFACVVLCAAFAPAANAQTAGTLSFQAQLNQGGSPFTGTVDLVFRIFDAELGGNLVDLNGDGVVNDVIGEDAQQVAGVQVTDGLLTTKWGPISPKAFDGTERWVEVTANGDLLSRFEIVTPPAAAEQLNAPGSGNAVASTTADGELGVGTDAPTARFEVVGNPSVMGTGTIASTPGLTTVTGAGTAFTTQLRVGDLLIISLPTPQERIIVAILNDQTLEVETPFSPELPAQAFVFQRPVACFTQDDGLPGVTVSADGRLGVGTTTPRAPLQVIGEARVGEITGEWDQSDSGYVRFGDLQIVWGRYNSSSSFDAVTTLPVAFVDANYTVALTPTSSATNNLTSSLKSRTPSSFIAQTSTASSSDRLNANGDYIAIGRWR